MPPLQVLAYADRGKPYVNLCRRTARGAGSRYHETKPRFYLTAARRNLGTSMRLPKIPDSSWTAKTVFCLSLCP